MSSLPHGWSNLGRPSDLVEREICSFVVQDSVIAVVPIDGHIHAFQDMCTHAQCLFSEEGEVEEGTLTCFCHFSMFDLETGEATNGPAVDPIRIYEVRLVDDELQVRL